MLGTKLYSGFDPRAIGDCALWLDAADRTTLTLSGSNVTRWSDKSGYNRHADASSNAPATDSNSGLYFSNSFYVTPLTGDPTTETGFVVFNSSITGMLVGSYSSGRQIGLQSSNTIGLLKAGVAWGPQATFTSGTRQLVTTQTSSTASSSLVNGGSNSATGGGFTYTSSNVTTLGRENGTSFPYIGFVYEIILYNSILSTVQRQQVEGYLARKWTVGSIGSNLTVTSPITPASLPNLAVWLDAADASSIDISGTAVTQWRDKSGSNNHASPAGVASPTVTSNFANGLSGVRGASNTYMSNTTMSVPLSNRTAFLVCSTYSTTTPTLGVAQLGTVPTGVAHGVDGLNTTVYQNQGSAQFGWIYRYFSGGGYYRQWSCNNFGATATTPFGIYAETVSNLVHYSYVNGGEYATTAFTAPPTDCSGYYLGARYDTNSVQYGYPATFAEFIVYRSSLTDTQRKQVEDYLINKWNISRTLSITLPVGHAYRPAPPALRPFTPMDLSGCVVWLDGADETQIVYGAGSNVSQIRDKGELSRLSNVLSCSQGVRVATGTLGNSLPTLSNLVGATTQVHGVSGNAAMTYVMVARVNTGANNIYIRGDLDSGGGNGYSGAMSLLLSSNKASIFLGVNQVGTITTGTSATSNTHVMIGSWDGTNGRIHDNGTLLATGNSNTPLSQVSATTKFEINDGNEFGEFMIYNRALSGAERQVLESYLTTKWGATGLTPSNHPARFSPALSPQFLPPVVGGCTLWLDAKDTSTFTLSGSNLSQWNDKSGGGYNLTQATTSNQPLLGTSNTITFQSNRHFNIPQAAINNATNYSIILAVNLVSASNYIFVKQFDGTNTYNVLTTTFVTPGANFGTSNYLYWRTSNAGTQANSGQSVGTGLQLLEILYDGSNVTMYKNGTLLSTTAATGGAANIANVTNATNFTLGVWNAGGIVYGNVTNFQLGELLFYNTCLTQSQRWQLESYLSQKWGLMSSLSSNNPFKNRPPL